jgi:hypothetical protein
MKRFYAYFNIVDQYVYSLDAEDAEQAAAIVYARLHKDYDQTLYDSTYGGWTLADSVVIEESDGRAVTEVKRDSLFNDSLDL